MRFTHCDLEVHDLLGERAHLIVEAESVFADIVGGEDKVSLPLLIAFYDLVFVGADDFVIYVEGTSGLNLPQLAISFIITALKNGRTAK